MDAGFVAIDFTQKPSAILDDIATLCGAELGWDESGTADVLLVKKQK